MFDVNPYSPYGYGFMPQSIYPNQQNLFTPQNMNQPMQQHQQQTAQMQQAPQNNPMPSVYQVSTVKQVEQVQITPGSKGLVMVQNESVIAMRVADNMGVTQTEYYKIEKFDPSQKQNQANADYLTRAEFNEFVASLSKPTKQSKSKEASSAIIRCGLETLLKRLPGFRIQISEITAADCLTEGLRIYKPDILIMNPSIPGNFNLQHLKDECGCPDMKCFALLYNVSDPFLLRSYDDQISVYDSADELKHKLERLNTEEVPPEEGESDDQQTLSSREKEIVVCVVKGMTNREIADRLYLSSHTVITHRRNIARKLQVHSASGLTVYAIVNKLIELKDLNG